MPDEQKGAQQAESFNRFNLKPLQTLRKYCTVNGYNIPHFASLLNFPFFLLYKARYNYETYHGACAILENKSLVPLQKGGYTREKER